MISTNKTYIYGRHAVTEALKNTPFAVGKIFADKNILDEKIIALIKKSSISLENLSREILREIGDEAVHQGIVAQIKTNNLLRHYSEFIQDLKINNNTCLILLGELQDIQNVGAIIRSAAAFGISGVLIPEHNQAPITGTVIKVSAGMAFKIPLVTISNTNNTLRDLKEKGFWIYGLEGDKKEAKQNISDEKFEAPTLFIIGNESKGIREKTKDICDILLRIPMSADCESLNAATSASIAMYEWSTKHKSALKS